MANSMGELNHNSLNPKNKHLIKGQKPQKNNKIFKATNIKPCYDGNMRWVCKCDLKLHPIALFIICKIFILASFISGLLFFILNKDYLLSLLIFVVCSIASCGVLLLFYYFVYAKIKKYYCNFYEMDSNTIRQYISRQHNSFDETEDLINKIGKTEESFNVFSKLHRLYKHKLFCKFSSIKKLTVYEKDFMLEIKTKDCKKLQIYANSKDIKFIYKCIMSKTNKGIRVLYI